MTPLLVALLFAHVAINALRLAIDLHYLKAEDDDDDC